MMKAHEEFLVGKLAVLPEKTQFSYIDPLVGAIREMLARGFSVSIKIEYDCSKEQSVYEIQTREETIDELIDESGLLLGAEFEKLPLREIAQFGADDKARKRILGSLENGFDVFLVPSTGRAGERTHYTLYSTLYDNS